MKQKYSLTSLVIAVFCVGFLVAPRFAAAHCDTLDGPVVKDARIALEKGDVTPVLKWVQKKDEAVIHKAFDQALAAGKKGEKAKEEGEYRFFEALVNIHRAGEGAAFTGLKPAGAVEPVIVAADNALVSGSAEDLVKLIMEQAAQGIRERHNRTVELAKHKDESVEAGRKYVEAYVDYTHYLERLQQDTGGHGLHQDEPGHKKAAKGHVH